MSISVNNGKHEEICYYAMELSRHTLENARNSLCYKYTSSERISISRNKIVATQLFLTFQDTLQFEKMTISIALDMEGFYIFSKVYTLIMRLNYRQTCRQWL